MFDFNKDKPFIENEFEHPSFDESTGLCVSQLIKETRRWFYENENMPSVIKRAESFRFLLRNAQIEVNPHTPFADKINLGIDYSGWAGTSFYEDYYKKSYREAFAERIPEDIRKYLQFSLPAIPYAAKDRVWNCSSKFFSACLTLNAQGT